MLPPRSSRHTRSTYPSRGGVVRHIVLLQCGCAAALSEEGGRVAIRLPFVCRLLPAQLNGRVLAVCQ